MSMKQFRLSGQIRIRSNVDDRAIEELKKSMLIEPDSDVTEVWVYEGILNVAITRQSLVVMTVKTTNALHKFCTESAVGGGVFVCCYGEGSRMLLMGPRPSARRAAHIKWLEKELANVDAELQVARSRDDNDYKGYELP